MLLAQVHGGVLRESRWLRACKMRFDVLLATPRSWFV